MPTRLLFAILVLIAANSLAADLPWPRWRGPQDNAHVAAG
jgi:hypothetical protein